MLDLADQRPLLFSVLLLLVGISVLAAVIQNRERRLNECESERKELEIDYKRRYDSIANYYAAKDFTLNEEVKNTLKTIIEEYKKRLEEQKGLNDKVKSTITETKKILNQTKN